jgi:hypothetical protein
MLQVLEPYPLGFRGVNFGFTLKVHKSIKAKALTWKIIQRPCCKKWLILKDKNKCKEREGAPKSWRTTRKLNTKEKHDKKNRRKTWWHYKEKKMMITIRGPWPQWAWGGKGRSKIRKQDNHEFESNDKI